MPDLSVRPAEKADFEAIVDYFLQADGAHLLRMGVDRTKFPSRADWLEMLETEHDLPFSLKKFWFAVWLEGEKAVGHSSINKLIFGKEGFVHLHFWGEKSRRRGLGAWLFHRSIGLFFEKLELEKVSCEPNAHNPAPNRTLEKLGFLFEKQAENTPGWLNFQQTTNLWSISRARFLALPEPVFPKVE